MKASESPFYQYPILMLKNRLHLEPSPRTPPVPPSTNTRGERSLWWRRPRIESGRTQETGPMCLVSRLGMDFLFPFHLRPKKTSSRRKKNKRTLDCLTGWSWLCLIQTILNQTPDVQDRRGKLGTKNIELKRSMHTESYQLSMNLMLGSVLICKPAKRGSSVLRAKWAPSPVKSRDSPRHTHLFSAIYMGYKVHNGRLGAHFVKTYIHH